MERNGQNRGSERAILAIYLVLYLFFVGKMLFYAVYVGHFPDEMEHISYVAYLESSGRILPDFSQMHILVHEWEDGSVLNQSDDFSSALHFSDRVNYLGHPPLYYEFLRLFRGIKISGDSVTVDIVRLRGANMLLAASAMLLILYLGWSRIRGGAAAHLLYGALCVSVPMLAYCCAGVNNDALAMLGFPIFLLGMLRWSEGNRGYGTALLIAVGVSVTMLAKLTAGMLVALTLLIGMLVTVWRQKSVRPLLTAPCLVSLPFYGLTAAYFLWVYLHTGSIQPTLRRISPAQFYASTFYVAPSERKSMNFFQFLGYFRYAMNTSWTGIFSHVRYQKSGSAWGPDQIALAAMWVLPAVLLPLWARFRSGCRKIAGVLAAGYAAILITAAIQCMRGYLEFRNVSGYLGGASSRYYLCAIPVLALSVALPSASGHEEIRRRRVVTAGSLLYTALLLYEDFGYFLLHFSSVIS